MVRIINKNNKPIFDLLTSFGLYNKFADDKQETIYVTSEQYAIGYVIHEIDKIKEKLNLK